jgi:predicted ATPase
VTVDRLCLIRYKGFENFTVHLRRQSLLVGPNNAGKSTIITALRVCATLIAQAKRRKAEVPLHDVSRDRRVRGYLTSLSRPQFSDENIRHEFRPEEARLELHLKNKAALYAIWPVDDDPFFYLEHIPGMQPNSVRVVKEYYGPIGVVPTLSPIEHSEAVLSSDHVRENITSRLVSRHFRNQMNLIRSDSMEDYLQLREFILDNTPEISSFELVVSGEGIDLFYREPNSRTEREMCWAGDGLQIWIQVLVHIWRQRGTTSLILDEPDVFLHPDLQRRLVRILEELPTQVVLATHAPEMLSEANRDSVVIIDRTKSRSRRITSERVLADLNDILGSGFNLKLARALRARVALFVEGDDMKILKSIAKAVGANFFARERGLTVSSMGGVSNRQLASSFGWVNQHLLDDAVQVAVFLDRDYLTDEMTQDIQTDFYEAGVKCHIWQRKELESYLLVPSLISRLSGAPEVEISKYLTDVVSSLKSFTLARYLDVRTVAERSAERHAVSVSEHYLKLFESLWTDSEWALFMSPAKEVLSGLNRRLQEDNYKAVSARGLAARIRAHEVPSEMRDALLEIEMMLSSRV